LEKRSHNMAAGQTADAELLDVGRIAETTLA